jgi:hypothetical protein
MQISDSLFQSYFLGISPQHLAPAAQALGGESESVASAGQWHLFARLSRPGLVAIRTVQRTTGQDLFLLKEEFCGVEDVAECMAFSFEPGGDERLRGVLVGNGCLFVTFIRLNWDVLHQDGWWQAHGLLERPLRSRLLEVLAEVLRLAAEQGEAVGKGVSFAVQGGMGDCDLILVGRVRSRQALDRFLLILTLLGTDNLAIALGAKTNVGKGISICAASTTELMLSWDLYARAMNSVCANGSVEESLRREIDGQLEAGLRAGLLLKRSCSSLVSTRDELGKCIPNEWMKHAVLGVSDVLLKWRNLEHGHLLSDLVNLMVLLEHQAHSQADFPRCVDVVLSFDDQTEPRASRKEVFGMELPELEPAPNVAPRATSRDGLKACVRYLGSILDRRMREELRIIERMAERCLTLQRNAELPMETRRLARLGLKRMGRAVERLESLAQKRVEGRLDGASHEEEAILRKALAESGSHLDRTLSHLTRGSIPLLLSSAAQARSTDHFSSETLLASALGAPAASVARRLLNALASVSPQTGKENHYQLLLMALDDMCEPILYASHDLDFRLIPPLGIIHAPRWVMWYPTASSSVLHELGHTVFSHGQFNHLLAIMCVKLDNDECPVGALRFCKNVVKDGAKASKQADKGDPTLWVQWTEERHEEAAEFFNRLFAYPSHASRQYVYDSLEYLNGMAGRQNHANKLYILERLLTIHITHSLVYLPNVSLWSLSEQTVQQCLRASLTTFATFLRQWMDEPPAPYQEDPEESRKFLIDDVIRMQDGILSALQGENGNINFGYQQMAGHCVQNAVLLALCATSFELEKPLDSGEGILAQTLWKAVFLAADEFNQSDEVDLIHEENLINALTSGTLLDKPTKWPEHLPRRLHGACRSRNKSVMVSQRIALTLTLLDWLSFCPHGTPDEENSHE